MAVNVVKILTKFVALVSFVGKVIFQAPVKFNHAVSFFGATGKASGGDDSTDKVIGNESVWNSTSKFPVKVTLPPIGSMPRDIDIGKFGEGDVTVFGDGNLIQVVEEEVDSIEIGVLYHSVTFRARTDNTGATPVSKWYLA